MIASLNGGHTH